MVHSSEISTALAQSIRKKAVDMVFRARASHIGSCLSVADILAVLYGDVLCIDPANPADPARDRLILSKGHAAAALYAALAERGFFPTKGLKDYCVDESPLAGHVTKGVPGVEVSTGGLGHGLPIGCGMALAAKRDGRAFRVYVVVGDGELNEGSNWEAMLFAARHRLDNLTLIVDHNKLQGLGPESDTLHLAPLAAKFEAFRLQTTEVDGHDHAALLAALSSPPALDQPRAVIAHTVKGKGVSFMENELAWHYKSPSPEDHRKACGELETCS